MKNVQKDIIAQLEANQLEISAGERCNAQKGLQMNKIVNQDFITRKPVSPTVKSAQMESSVIHAKVELFLVPKVLLAKWLPRMNHSRSARKELIKFEKEIVNALNAHWVNIATVQSHGKLLAIVLVALFATVVALLNIHLTPLILLPAFQTHHQLSVSLDIGATVQGKLRVTQDLTCHMEKRVNVSNVLMVMLAMILVSLILRITHANQDIFALVVSSKFLANQEHIIRDRMEYQKNWIAFRVQEDTSALTQECLMSQRITFAQRDIIVQKDQQSSNYVLKDSIVRAYQRIMLVLLLFVAQLDTTALKEESKISQRIPVHQEFSAQPECVYHQTLSVVPLVVIVNQQHRTQFYVHRVITDLKKVSRTKATANNVPRVSSVLDMETLQILCNLVWLVTTALQEATEEINSFVPKDLCAQKVVKCQLRATSKPATLMVVYIKIKEVRQAVRNALLVFTAM